MNVPAPISQGEIIESVMIKGDLSKLSAEERARYYVNVCQSVGLNPMTRPFEYIILQGKLTLYAKRDCADQLRKLHGISIKVVDQKIDNDLLTVHVQAKDRTGKQDEDFGVVSLPENTKGEARANLIMKAITKAKRRVTLSISGLGFPDESELDDVSAQFLAVEPSPQADVFDEPKSVSGDADHAAPATTPAPRRPAGAAAISSDARAQAMIDQMKKLTTLDALAGYGSANKAAFAALDDDDRIRVNTEYRTLRSAMEA